MGLEMARRGGPEPRSPRGAVEFPAQDIPPQLGFRAWSLRLTEPMLAGLSHTVPWYPGDNQAHCDSALCSVRGSRFAHQIAGPGTTCGFYAYHQYSDALHLATDPDNGQVEGAVSGWGLRTIHRHGWRAQFARIVAISDTGEAARDVASAYGVPCVPRRLLASVAREFGASFTPQPRLKMTIDEASQIAAALGSPPDTSELVRHIFEQMWTP